MKELRIICLKEQCLTNIRYLLCIEPVSLVTRDALVKLPSLLLMEIYQTFEMDLTSNSIEVVFMLHEIMLQRTFQVENSTLYQSACTSFIRRCGFLTSDEISIYIQKMESNVLNDLSNIFLHEHWCSIISKILSEREGSLRIEDNL